ncbi:MAG: S9 family peptidase [Bdellovibrio sp.]|nr:S9 family peptidase [Bdellovibrio sp.]
MKIIILLAIGALACSHNNFKKDNSYQLRQPTPADIETFKPTVSNPELLSKIESYLDIRSPSYGILSPDGKVYYFNWNVTGTTQIWKINGPLGFPIQLTAGNEHTYLAGITKDGKQLIFSRDHQGDENYGIYFLPVEGGVATPLFARKNVRASIQKLGREGRYIYYRSNKSASDVFTFTRYDLKTDEHTDFFERQGQWSISDIRGDDMLFSYNKGSTVVEIYQFNMQTKELSPLLGLDEENEFAAEFAPASGKYLVRTNKFSNFRKLYLYDGATFEDLLKNEDGDVGYFSLDWEKTKIMYEKNVQGQYRLGALRTVDYKPLQVPKFKDVAQTHFGYTTFDGRYTAIHLNFDTKPGENQILDWNNGKTVKWTEESLPNVAKGQLVASTQETIPARDGTLIPILVRRPHKCLSLPCPVIVNFHGGPEGQVIAELSLTAQIFVDEGFIYVEPNVRGSDGYGKAYFHADDKEKRLHVISDIADIGKYIRQNWKEKQMSPKVGVMGGSYGGYSALMAMTKFAGTYDAGVSEVGMVSLVTFLQKTANYRRKLRESEYGSLANDMLILEQLSPINYVEQIQAPLLVVQGVNDPRVPVSEALLLNDILKKKGIPMEMILFSDEGHGVSKRNNQALYLARVVEFFKKYLGMPTQGEANHPML